MIKYAFFFLRYFFDNKIFKKKQMLVENSFNIKIKNYLHLKEVIKKLKVKITLFPESHHLYFLLGNYNYAYGSTEYLSYYDLSEKKRLTQIEEYKLVKEKIEFIPSFGINGSFGNILWFYYWIIAKETNLVTNKQTCIILRDNSIKNKDVYNYFKDKITIKKSNKINNYLSKVLTIPVGHYFPFKDKANCSIYESMNLINSYCKKNNFNRYYKIQKNDLSHGLQILDKLKIPKNAWYVTIHVRDGSSYNDHDNQAHRNANIYDYLKAIDFITSKGGYVIRVGDANMPKLPQRKNLIDYAHSKYKSQKMDIFLASTCKFLIGTSSGFWALNHIFGKPVLMTNCLFAHNYWALDIKDLYLPRILKTSKESPLNFSQHFDIPNSIALIDVKENLRQKNIYWETNSEDDILKAVMEMYKRVNMNNISKNNNLEKKYKSILRNISIKYNNNKLEPFADIPEFFLNKFEELQSYKKS